MKNYSNASRVRFETLREMDFGDITADFTVFGAPYANPARIIDIFNDTDQPIQISFDGTNAAIYCPAHSGRVYDFGSNRQASSDELEQAKFTQAYIEYYSATPSTGAVFLGVIYASND